MCSGCDHESLYDPLFLVPHFLYVILTTETLMFHYFSFLPRWDFHLGVYQGLFIRLVDNNLFVFCG